MITITTGAGYHETQPAHDKCACCDAAHATLHFAFRAGAGAWVPAQVWLCELCSEEFYNGLNPIYKVNGPATPKEGTVPAYDKG